MMPFVCAACTYPSRLPDCCDNPRCVENPSVSQAQKDVWRVEADRRRETEEEREHIRRIRERMRAL